MNGSEAVIGFNELLQETKALLSAAQKGDLDEIGRLLEKRSQTIDTLKAGGGSEAFVAAHGDLFSEIQSLDQKANAKIRELRDDKAREIGDFKKKSAGLLKYQFDSCNLQSGQMIDKRD